MRIDLSQCLKVGGVKFSRRPLAFDRDRRSLFLRQYEIHLVSPLVTPVADISRLKPRVHFVQDKMLPYKTQVVTPKLVPAAMIANKACIESVHFRSGNNFRRAVGAVRTEHMDDEGRLQHGEIVGNRGSTDLAGPRESGRLENAAALAP